MKRYRLKTGTQPVRFEDDEDGFWDRKSGDRKVPYYYEKHGPSYPTKWRLRRDFVPYEGGEDAIENGENTDMKDQLYSFEKDGKTVFCVRIGTDSSKNAVVEIKGGGEIVAVAPKLLTEVLPPAVSIAFFNTPGKSYHYLMPEGDVQLEVGDLVMVDNDPSRMARVTNVGITSRQATKPLSGTRIKGDAI